MEDKGHKLEFSTISAADMRAVIIGVGHDEQARLRKKALAIPSSRRNKTDTASIVRWGEGARELWTTKNANFLDTLSDSGAKYVESVFVMFSGTLVANSEFLQFYVLDACAGKVYVDCYTLSLIVGFSSNGAYAWISANEGTSSWSRFLNFVHRHLPGFYERARIISDRDKGVAAAIATVFANCMPHQIFCIKHRLENIARHIRSIRDVYKGMALASTEEALKAIRESDQRICSIRQSHRCCT